jgi:hypothetical protein
MQRGLGNSGNDKGLHRRTAGLRLVRFHPMSSCSPDNLVLLTEEEVSELRTEGVEAWSVARPEVAAFVCHTLKRVALLFGNSGPVGNSVRHRWALW